MMNLKKLNNNWRKGILLSACFVLALSVLPGCKKTSSKYGTEALNIDDLLANGGVDSFQLKTSSILLDTIATDNQLYGTLGIMHDPKFGIVNASIYTQLSINGSLTIGSAATVDSVVLSLNYEGGYYGSLEPQTFEVYQLAETLHKDSVYKRTTTKNTMGTNLVEASSATQTPNPTDKVVINGIEDTLNAQLRLRLNNSFGQQFIDDIVAGNSAFTSNDNFLSSGYFKGFRINAANIPPASGNGAVLYFRLGNVDTKMTIYYKLDNEPGNPREVSFLVNSSCADFNHVEFNNAGYGIANVLSNPLYGQTQYYSQSFYAIPKIEMPTLTNLSSKSLINNALLYLPIAFQPGTKYYPTQDFQVAYRAADGTFTLLGTSGTILTASYDNSQKAYVIDLRHHIQELVSRKKDNTGLYLIPVLSRFTCTVDRVVFNGTSSPYKTKPKLVIKYTEFN